MRLTSLLRGVLRSEGEFTTLGRELDVVEAYLDIERARFEQRLRVTIDVPLGSAASACRRWCCSRSSRTPSSTASRRSDAAARSPSVRSVDPAATTISASCVDVRDTGAGATATSCARARRATGVGLRNVERRLACQYGAAASLVDRRHPARARRSKSACPCTSSSARSRTVDRVADVSARLRVVIADDERPARSFLVALLRSFDDVAVVGEAASGKEAVAMIEREQPDLALLDWQMPELDGIGVVRMLKKRRMPLIAFVTAYDEYAVRAFEVNAVDYLLKPVEKARLRETMNRAQERIEHAEIVAEQASRVGAAIDAYESSAQSAVSRADSGAASRRGRHRPGATRSPRSSPTASCCTSRRSRTSGTRSPTG